MQKIDIFVVANDKHFKIYLYLTWRIAFESILLLAFLLW